MYISLINIVSIYIDYLTYTETEHKEGERHFSKYVVIFSVNM